MIRIKHVHIMRGLPGSGKTTFARQLLRCPRCAGKGSDCLDCSGRGMIGAIISTDDWLPDANRDSMGKRQWDDVFIAARATVESYMKQGFGPLVCDMCHISRRAIIPWIERCQSYGYSWSVHSTHSNPQSWDWPTRNRLLQAFCERNHHKVSYRKISEMADRWEEIDIRADKWRSTGPSYSARR